MNPNTGQFNGLAGVQMGMNMGGMPQLGAMGGGQPQQPQQQQMNMAQMGQMGLGMGMGNPMGMGNLSVAQMNAMGMPNIGMQQQQQMLQAQQQAQQAEQSRLSTERARQQAAADSRQYLPLSKEAPEYPARALDKNIEGDCSVEYTVNTKGQIENPKVLDGCHPLFIRPSLAAAQTFRYQPRIVDGVAVAVPSVRNTFHFRIK